MTTCVHDNVSVPVRPSRVMSSPWSRTNSSTEASSQPQRPATASALPSQTAPITEERPATQQPPAPTGGSGAAGGGADANIQLSDLRSILSNLSGVFTYLVTIVVIFVANLAPKKLNISGELCFIYNDYSSTRHDLLKTANTEHLHVKRIKEMACKVFKIVNNIAPSFIQNLIILRCSQYSMRNDNSCP